MRRKRAGRVEHRRARLVPPGAAAGGLLLVDTTCVDADLGELCQDREVRSAASLQQVLLVPTRMNSQEPEGVVEGVTRLHTAHRAGVVESVLLAATHRGWRDGGRALIHGVDGSGVLDADNTRQIAQALLRDHLEFSLPGEWVAGQPVLLIKDRPRLVPARGAVTTRRLLSTQLRRWAAARRVVEGEDVTALTDRARELDSRHGAAIITGMLDATELVDEQVAGDIRSLALSWSAPSVRLAAVKQLATAGGHRETLARIAEDDPASTVRQWAVRHVHGHARSGDGARQDSLFDW